MNNSTFNAANSSISNSLSRPNLLRYAIFAAESCLHILEAEYPEDKRPIEAVEAAKRVLADDSEKNREAARTAANAANAAAAAYYAAYAAYYAASYNAAYYAANAAAYAAAYAYTAAYNAANAASYADPSLMLPILRYGIKLMQQQKLPIEDETLKQIAVDVAVDDMLVADFTESII